MKPIKRAIILCWIMLVACFIIKLFGGNWFEVVCTNEHFSNFCHFIDNNIILREIIGFSLYLFSGYFIFRSMSLLTECNKKTTIVIILILFVLWLTHFISDIFKMVVEVLVFAITPFVLNKCHYKENFDLKEFIKKKWYLGISGYLTIIIFQLISVLTRNIGVTITEGSLLVTSILMIDYNIMVFLYYLYVKLLKEENENG